MCILPNIKKQTIKPQDYNSIFNTGAPTVAPIIKWEIRDVGGDKQE